MISDKQLWNPTLSELICYLSKLKLISFKCNEVGGVTIENSNGILYRNLE